MSRLITRGTYNDTFETRRESSSGATTQTQRGVTDVFTVADRSETWAEYGIGSCYPQSNTRNYCIRKILKLASARDTTHYMWYPR